MSVTYRLVRAPFSESLITEVQSLAQQVFGRSNEEGAWRYDHMPDFTLFEARVGERLVGFKMGYAHTPTRYYSWLGGVDTDYRRQGIARDLMSRQHVWLAANGYQSVETGARQDNHAMAELNLTSGFQVVGIRFKGSVADTIYEKPLDG